jgi:hypothetical protein
MFQLKSQCKKTKIELKITVVCVITITHYLSLPLIGSPQPRQQELIHRSGQGGKAIHTWV